MRALHVVSGSDRRRHSRSRTPLAPGSNQAPERWNRHHVPITGEQTSEWLDRWDYAIRFVHVARRRKGRAHLEVTLKRNDLIIKRVPDDEFDEVRDYLDTAVEVANEST
jgi:hypothetical protein